eukprot:3680847-Rhodomonas_salina.3
MPGSAQPMGRGPSQLTFLQHCRYSYTSKRLFLTLSCSADLVQVKRALISVSDKTNLLVLAEALKNANVQVLSTGGTAKALKEAGLPVTDVSDYTGFPEMMDGRVKTLHPKVHGGLLALRGNADHEKACTDHGIDKIDMLVVNLYPFQATVAKGADFDTCIENIDIGGPAMIRGAAKNHPFVTVLTNVDQYAKVIEELNTNKGSTTLKTRRTLAAAAYSHCAAYDSAVSTWFSAQNNEEPAVTTRAYELAFPLKYGCNPHQLPANIYSLHGATLPFKVLNGKVCASPSPSRLFHFFLCPLSFAWCSSHVSQRDAGGYRWRSVAQ